MLYYATKYRFSTLGPVPASCSKEQDLVLCSLGWQLFFGGQGGRIRYTDRHRQDRWQERKKWKKKKWQRGVFSFVTLTYCCLPFFFFTFNSPFQATLRLFSPALEIRSQLFSLLFDLRVHKPPSVNVPPPTPKTGKDFPSDINPISA